MPDMNEFIAIFLGGFVVGYITHDAIDSILVHYLCRGKHGR